MGTDIYANRNVALRDIPLTSAYFRTQTAAFLNARGLTPSDLPEYMAGIYDEADESLLACGGLDGSTIKCLAVDPEVRQLNLAGKLVTHLTDRAMHQTGTDNVTVFTKPENLELFRSMGFHPVGQARKAIMMERDRHALTRYTDYLKTLRHEGLCGVIVMNANPLTRGHLYLIDEARKRTDHLFIILVSEHKLNMFGYSERKAMLQEALRGMNDVTVVEGSIYSVSAATFPSYFIKEKSKAAEAHIELDLDIFSRHLAPALGVTVRFVGHEPLDLLTAAYNEGMHRLLPPRGIAVTEVQRLRPDAAAEVPFISAGGVRSLLTKGETARALALAAPTAAPYILTKAACTALRAELELTPKPGLVDRENNGAHRDMDYALMTRSIEALEPAFREIALAAHRMNLPDCTELARIGREGEAEMLQATGGVNTHKGALFALGLATAATSHLLAKKGRIKTDELQKTIARSAANFPRPEATHGAAARRKYGAQGALDNALTGYATLFDDWLPYLLHVKGRPEAQYLLLLKIMAAIDDTNVLHRAGKEAAEDVKRQAAALLENFSTDALQAMDRDLTARHISPGGAADMLALTLYVAGVCGG